ncbi:hypothetical protein LINGRAHAP2_LOCUS5339 [Linum grandiflorum]
MLHCYCVISFRYISHVMDRSQLVDLVKVVEHASNHSIQHYFCKENVAREQIAMATEGQARRFIFVFLGQLRLNKKAGLSFQMTS